MRMGFFTDTSVCIGCKACEVACKEWNDVPDDGLDFLAMSYDNTGALGADTWRHVAFVERSAGADMKWWMSSDVCKHCTHAACLDVCPTGALFRTEFDTVVVQQDVCNGCGYCVPACPFGVVDRVPEDGRAGKCTLCYDRLEDGLEPEAGPEIRPAPDETALLPHPWAKGAEILTGWVFDIASIPTVRMVHHMIMWMLLGFMVHHVYSVMLEHCDIHMGFKLIPEGYANWVTLSRPYYESQYVFVTADPDLQALADVAPTRPIGATMGTSAHIRLVSYLAALPQEDRWPTYPMGTNELALESLLDGTVDVALVWAPNLWAGRRQWA